MTTAAARKAIREAYAAGWATDALVQDYATERMGGSDEARAVVERVFQAEFQIMGAN